jgi:hypothetical protein
MQRGNRRHQIHAGLPGVEQRAGRLEVQRPPAPSGDPLHELVGAGLAHVHRAQQAAVGNARGAVEHARRVGRATGDVGRCAARGRPGRRGRQHHVHRERRERQGHEAADECRPLGAVTQPEHPGHGIGQHEERHVDAADQHLPPRRLRQLDVLLQPHRRERAEKHPPIGVGLELPERRGAERVGRAAAEVVEHQDQSERQPIAHHRKHFVSASDAGRDQPGGDVQQQQFTVEGQSVGDGAVDHHRGPRGDGDAARPDESTLAAGPMRCGDRPGGVRRPAGASGPSRPGRGVGLERSNPAVGCHCHWTNLILCRPFSVRSFLRPCRYSFNELPKRAASEAF